MVKKQAAGEGFLMDDIIILGTWGMGIFAGLIVLLGWGGIVSNPVVFKGFGIELTSTNTALFIALFCIIMAFLWREKTRPAVAKLLNVM